MIAHRRQPRALCSAAFLLASAAFTLAQTPPVPTPSATISPSDVMLLVQKFYRTNPICERVTLEVRSPASPNPAAAQPSTPPPTLPRVRRAQFIVRQIPAAVPTTPGSPPFVEALALQLGSLNIWATPGEVLAMHSQNPAAYFAAPISGAPTAQTLSGLMPPVILPQVALVQAGDTPLREIWPLVSDISWSSATRDPRTSLLTVSGQGRAIAGSADPVSIVLEILPPRLRTLSITLPAGERITLRITPESSCSPRTSELKPDGRTSVATLADLRPAGLISRAEPGDRLPALALQTPTGEPWVPENWLKPDAASLGILILQRETDKPSPSSAALVQSLAALSGAQVDSRTLPLLISAPVLIMPNLPADARLARLDAAAKQWARQASPLLWSPDARSSIDLLTAAPAAIVLLDSSLTIEAIIDLDLSAPAPALQQLEAALLERAARTPALPKP